MMDKITVPLIFMSWIFSGLAVLLLTPYLAVQVWVATSMHIIILTFIVCVAGLAMSYIVHMMFKPWYKDMENFLEKWV